MLRLTLLALMVAASAAAAPAAALGKLNALRGHHHTHKHHTHKHGDMRFQKVGTKATVAKAGSEGKSKPVHIIPASLAKTDNVAREGLGENLPYKGIDCEFSLLLHPQPSRPPCRNKRTPPTPASTRSRTARPATPRAIHRTCAHATQRAKCRATQQPSPPPPTIQRSPVVKTRVSPFVASRRSPPGFAPTPTLAPAPSLALPVLRIVHDVCVPLLSRACYRRTFAPVLQSSSNTPPLLCAMCCRVQICPLAPPRP